MQYPAILTADDNGTVVVEIPDVPGVISAGANETDALALGQDALLTILACYIKDGLAIPPSSTPAPGQKTVDVPTMAAVKLAIANAMRTQGVSQKRLASLLNTDPKAVRRLLDLWHNSRWDHLEAALAVLGLTVSVEIRKAA